MHISKVGPLSLVRYYKIVYLWSWTKYISNQFIWSTFVNLCFKMLLKCLVVNTLQIFSFTPKRVKSDIYIVPPTFVCFFLWTTSFQDKGFQNYPAVDSVLMVALRELLLRLPKLYCLLVKPDASVVIIKGTQTVSPVNWGTDQNHAW